MQRSFLCANAQQAPWSLFQMTNENLLKWRMLVPGMAALLAAWTLDPSFSLSIHNPESIALPIGLCAVIGSLYYVLDIRRVLVSWHYIDNNIKHRLLATIGPTNLLTSSQREYLLEGKKLLDVYYALLDNVESLKTRQEAVRMNGLLVTSFADAALVSEAAAVFHYGSWFLSERSVSLSWSVCFVVAWVACEAILVPRALSRHERLSNDQLDLISNLHASKLLTDIKTVLQGMQGGTS